MTAILHEGAPGPVLGPRPRPGPATAARGVPVRAGRRAADLDRPHPDARAAALEQAAFDVTPDGSTVVTTWRVDEPHGASRQALVALDVPTDTHPAAHRVLLDDPDHTVDGPVAVSPDGRWVACLRTRRTVGHRAPGRALRRRARRRAANRRDVAPGWDRWSPTLAWTPDSAALVVTADDAGRAPLFRVDLATGTVARLTDDDGAYTDPVVGPDGTVYALRVAVDAPPAPVRLGPEPVPRSRPLPPPGPGARRCRAPSPRSRPPPRTARPCAPGSCCPTARRPTTPAPLLLWIHGGPLSSWNAWPWRWNPWLMAAHGYAVLLPDPALSTGYGRAFVTRGWGRWGAEPYTDLMALTDAAERRPDIDADAHRGDGRLVRRLHGQLGRRPHRPLPRDRHAREPVGARPVRPHHRRPGLLAPRADPARCRREHSPHRHADAIRTPMLVIHGDKDYRVPIGEALRLWSDLVARCSDQVPHKFLYFPDENHWVLRPQHARLWYATVLAFLDHHLHGADWVVPDLLR